jgi:hypothetical protein
MIDFADRLDRQLILIVDSFCEHLQKQVGVPFGWMLTTISLGTAAIASTASMLMFREVGTGGVFAALWILAFAAILMFLRRTLWRQMRDWPDDVFRRHWSTMALMTRDNGRPIRFVTLAGTILLIPGALIPIFSGQPELSINSLRFLFVSMVPITIMMYAFCALPHDSSAPDQQPPGSDKID